MAIHDLYSKRQKAIRGEVPEIYTYDKFPQGLKVQIVHIIKDALGVNARHSRSDCIEEIYKYIRDILVREYEVFSLNNSSTFENELLNFFLKEPDVERSLDIVGLTFRIIDEYIRENEEYRYNTVSRIEPDEAISELNDRFKEHGFGFQYEAGQIIRVDSTYIHNEIVKPTIKLLWNKKFDGANEEYLKAHEHYKNGKNKECLAECLKAVESTMKIICNEKGWAYNPHDTAKALINTCFLNQLIPTFAQSQFTSLRSLLETGVLPIRNRLGGHGQGPKPQIVYDEITRYALNLTGANIIFLIEQSGL